MDNVRLGQISVNRHKNTVSPECGKVCGYPLIGVFAYAGDASFILGNIAEKRSELFNRVCKLRKCYLTDLVVILEFICNFVAGVTDGKLHHFFY